MKNRILIGNRSLNIYFREIISNAYPWCALTKACVFTGGVSYLVIFALKYPTRLWTQYLFHSLKSCNY